MIGLDTSVVVRLLVGEPEAQAAAARRLMNEAGPGTLVISDVVIAESYFALRHHYGAPHGKTVEALRGLLEDRRAYSTGAGRRLLQTLTGRETAPGFIDRLIHAGYENEGMGTVTFDRDASRLGGATLL